jgi:hypothetical protein
LPADPEFRGRRDTSSRPIGILIAVPGAIAFEPELVLRQPDIGKILSAVDGELFLDPERDAE